MARLKYACAVENETRQKAIMSSGGSMNSKDVKKLAFECEADIVGIASIDRVKGMAAEGNPLNIKPDAKSVIVLGFQVLRGTLRGIDTGSCWGTFGMGSPFTCMMERTYNFCRLLESDGWEAVPLVKQNKGLRNQGVPVSPDKPAPDIIVDMEYLAYAAGLGHCGEGKLFLTPQYGPRQYFTAVLCDLELAADPLFAGSVCDGCGECLKACPAQAYKTDSWSEESFPSGIFKWRPLRIESCEVCRTGVVDNVYSTGIGGDPNRLGAACGRACVAHLESSGRLTMALKSSFR
jgi:epoxyqueuosine reductase QueG